MTRPDDQSIPDTEPLWRRVSPDQLKPREGGAFEVSSVAFRDKSGEISVHLSSLTTKELALARFPTFSLAALPAGTPRKHGLAVSRDPLPEDSSHALICPKTSKGQARLLAEACELVVLKPPLPSP